MSAVTKAHTPAPVTLIKPGTATDTREDARFVPLRVTAYLDQPLVSYGDPLHLDALVAGGAFQLWNALGQPALPTPDKTWLEDFWLPISRWTCPRQDVDPLPGVLPESFGAGGVLWGWCASREEGAVLHEGRAEVRKKACVGEMVIWSSDDQVSLTTGWSKPWDLSYPTQLRPRLEWWCLGEPERLRVLLDLVTHLGKKRHHGWGRVRSWEIEEDVEAREKWKRRVLPWEMAVREGLTREGVDYPRADKVRAPYWHASRQTWCWRPGMERGEEEGA